MILSMAKAQRLATERGVQITTEVADLSEYAIELEKWNIIVSIFCHVSQKIRTEVHTVSLHPGATRTSTGGPPVRELMMSLAGLKLELAGLDFEHALETEREIIEGRLHTGRGAVVQLIARKPC